MYPDTNNTEAKTLQQRLYLVCHRPSQQPQPTLWVQLRLIIRRADVVAIHIFIIILTQAAQQAKPAGKQLQQQQQQQVIIIHHQL